jgi:hypothetical protein
MSLYVELRAMKPTVVFEYNISHNLNEIADAVSLYEALWHPEMLHITTARQLIKPLEEGLSKLLVEQEHFELLAEQGHFEQFNPENGWGSYESLVSFVKQYIEACKKNPDAEVWVSA